MHIEHNQFLDLIAETSGIDLEKAKKQLEELLSEINNSLADQQAYEIEGFGIFSKLGYRIMFIPSNELETEINYKYAGMEPIEMHVPKPIVEDISEQISQNQDTNPSTESRFEGLIDSDLLAENPLNETEEEPLPGPDEWGVEAHQEEESADRLFASLMGEEYEQEEIEDNTSTLQDKIDSELNLKNTNISEQMLDSLEDLDFEIKTPEETKSSEIEDEENLEHLFFQENEDSLENNIITVNALETSSNTKKPSKNRSKIVRVEDKIKSRQKNNSLNKLSLGKDIPPISMWIITLTLGICGVTIALAFLNVINIPFITPKQAPIEYTLSSTPPLTVQNKNTMSSNGTNQELAKHADKSNYPDTITPSKEEQEMENTVRSTNNDLLETPVEKYGVTGLVSAEGNDGYTIVLFTLQSKMNATYEMQKLVEKRYRSFLIPVANTQFGTMYRVCLGQFSSISNATMTSERIKEILPKDYIIKKIN